MPGLSLTSFTSRSRTPSLVRQEFAGRHGFQISEAAIGGEWLLFLAVAVLFGRRVPETARTAETLAPALREARDSFEVLANKRAEISGAIELSRTRLAGDGSSQISRNMLHIEVLETFQEIFVAPEGSAARLRALVERLSRSSHLPQHGNVLAEEIADLEQRISQQRVDVMELENGARESNRFCGGESGNYETRQELARAREELTRLNLLHSALVFVRNMSVLQENAFAEAFGE